MTTYWKHDIHMKKKNTYKLLSWENSFLYAFTTNSYSKKYEETGIFLATQNSQKKKKKALLCLLRVWNIKKYC